MNELKSAYENDFHHWIEQHIELLRTGRVLELDTEHLIEELEGMANRDKNALISHCKILLTHLLKWPFQQHDFTENNNIILEQRSEIHDLLENIPSLKNQLAMAVTKAYPKAVILAAKETGLDKNSFPVQCPYSVGQLLDDEFYPVVD
jgi:hypothetical protein